MNSPQELAHILMTHYLTKETDNLILVNMVSTEDDNEYILEILTHVYLECYRIYTGQEQVDVQQYSSCINAVFNSIGYVIIMELMERDKLKDHIHFAKIVDMRMTLNRYHPMRIREGITMIRPTVEVPDLLESLFSDRGLLPNCTIVHDIDPNDDVVMILKFQWAKVHRPL